MIAMSLFIVVMMIGIDVVLAVNNSHKANINQRAVMDNLSFTMEDMARNIRLGTDFHCVTSSFPLLQTYPTIDAGGDYFRNDCPNSGTQQGSFILSFNGINNTRIVYDMTSLPNDYTNGYITKASIDNASFNSSTTPFGQITPPEVHIDLNKSGFTVSGSGVGDGKQPLIIIRLYGTAVYENNSTPFDIQTSISPRNLDS